MQPCLLLKLIVFKFVIFIGNNVYGNTNMFRGENAVTIIKYAHILSVCSSSKFQID